MTGQAPGQIITAVQAIMSEARPGGVADVHVALAIRRLGRVMLEYEAWATMNAAGG